MNEVIESPFAAQRSATVAETSGARQTQSRELAEMQTKYLMAQQFPRDERKAMDGIINAFSRPGLAERAQYEYGKGGSSVAGPSIHSAQAIAQQWGNIEFGWREISRGIGHDGVPFSEVEAFAIDLQTRVPSRITFIAKHWRDTKSGGYKLKEEREIYELCANMAQRRKRACILAILPQDVIDSAMEQAALTLRTKADTSADAMHKMVEAFAQFGVTKGQIEKRIQRRLDAITPTQVVMLKRIYASLRDEMSDASEWFETATEPPASSGIEAVKAAAAAKKTAPAKKPIVDPDTGEIGRPVFDEAGFAKKLQSCTDTDVLDLAADELRDIPDEAMRDRLTEIYTARRKAIA